LGRPGGGSAPHHSRLYLVRVNCLGHTLFEVWAGENGCAAVVRALERFPQACAISARPIGGAA
jgi:hypothetical protein